MSIDLFSHTDGTTLDYLPDDDLTDMESCTEVGAAPVIVDFQVFKAWARHVLFFVTRLSWMWKYKKIGLGWDGLDMNDGVHE